MFWGPRKCCKYDKKKYDLVLAGNLKKKPGRESVQIHTKKKKKRMHWEKP